MNAHATDDGGVGSAPDDAHGVRACAVENVRYYEAEFERIEGRAGLVFTWNRAAAILGPVWGAARGAWGFFWFFPILELFALVQVGRGLWGELGAGELERHDRIRENIERREARAAELRAAGETAEADASQRIADNLRAAAETALEAASAADAAAFPSRSSVSSSLRASRSLKVSARTMPTRRSTCAGAPAGRNRQVSAGAARPSAWQGWRRHGR